MAPVSLDITSPSIISCGAGAFSRIADEAARLGTRAAIVTGSHLHGSDEINCLLEDLADRSVATFVSPPIISEPTVEMVDELAAIIKASGADVVIEIGGGSVMDAAKAAAVMTQNDGTAEDYQLRRREIMVPPIAQIAVPTTAGTGSEATRVSVLTNNALGIKRSISHPWMTPDVAILDPKMTASLPEYLTTVTAMDAFSHAIESAVAKNANAYTRSTALAAIGLLARGLPECQRNPGNLNARLDCLMGSCFAGLSMQAGLGASHSLAPAICIVGNIRHSEAVAALLPNVIELNERSLPETYADIARAMGTRDSADRLRELCASGGFAGSLKKLALKPEGWDEVCKAMNRYGSHRQSNPVDVSDTYAEELYNMSM